MKIIQALLLLNLLCVRIISRGFNPSVTLHSFRHLYTSHLYKRTAKSVTNRTFLCLLIALPNNDLHFNICEREKKKMAVDMSYEIIMEVLKRDLKTAV